MLGPLPKNLSKGMPGSFRTEKSIGNVIPPMCACNPCWAPQLRNPRAPLCGPDPQVENSSCGSLGEPTATSSRGWGG